MQLHIHHRILTSRSGENAMPPHAKLTAEYIQEMNAHTRGYICMTARIIQLKNHLSNFV
jgi:hypothetical protein